MTQGKPTGNEPIRILVVDDEHCIRSSLVAFFEDEEMEVQSAGSAEEAMVLLKEAETRGKQFHCAIVDLRLPGMSGDVLILKAHRMFSGIHYLIHTGSSSYQLSDELKQIGIQPGQVYIKPLKSLGILINAIKEQIAT